LSGANDINYRHRNDAGTVIFQEIFVNDVDGTLRNYSLRDTASQFQPYVDGTANTFVSYTRAGVTTLNLFGLGANPTATFIEAMTGYISEAIFFPSVLSNTDLNTVNASQGAAFGITVVAI
jgi:hypothetical protein